MNAIQDQRKLARSSHWVAELGRRWRLPGVAAWMMLVSSVAQVAALDIQEFGPLDRPGASQNVLELLDVGSVVFEVSDARPSTQSEMRSTGAAGRRFDAETRFRLRYQFDSRCRYGWDGDELWIRVRYPQLELLVDHRIWFRSGSQMARRDDESFWEHPIVRHELDHVRLSSDVRLQSLFRHRVESRPVLRMDIRDVQERLQIDYLDKEQRLTNRQLRSLIGHHVRTQFEQIVELIEIRYVELDRITRHGALAIPEDSESELRHWLGIAVPPNSNAAEITSR
ncbi:MAG: hypothetical protein AAGJ40_13955 [Planctomycetota bacterium]